MRRNETLHNLEDDFINKYGNDLGKERFNHYLENRLTRDNAYGTMYWINLLLDHMKVLGYPDAYIDYWCNNYDLDYYIAVMLYNIYGDYCKFYCSDEVNKFGNHTLYTIIGNNKIKYSTDGDNLEYHEVPIDFIYKNLDVYNGDEFYLKNICNTICDITYKEFNYKYSGDAISYGKNDNGKYSNFFDILNKDKFIDNQFNKDESYYFMCFDEDGNYNPLFDGSFHGVYIDKSSKEFREMDCSNLFYVGMIIYTGNDSSVSLNNLSDSSIPLKLNGINNDYLAKFSSYNLSRDVREAILDYIKDNLVVNGKVNLSNLKSFDIDDDLDFIKNKYRVSLIGCNDKNIFDTIKSSGLLMLTSDDINDDVFNNLYKLSIEDYEKILNSLYRAINGNESLYSISDGKIISFNKDNGIKKVKRF